MFSMQVRLCALYRNVGFSTPGHRARVAKRRSNALTALIFALQAAQLFHEDGRTRE
jgi:hypothetical protein